MGKGCAVDWVGVGAVVERGSSIVDVCEMGPGNIVGDKIADPVTVTVGEGTAALGNIAFVEKGSDPGNVDDGERAVGPGNIVAVDKTADPGDVVIVDRTTDPGIAAIGETAEGMPEAVVEGSGSAGKAVGCEILSKMPPIALPDVEVAGLPGFDNVDGELPEIHVWICSGNRPTDPGCFTHFELSILGCC